MISGVVRLPHPRPLARRANWPMPTSPTPSVMMAYTVVNVPYGALLGVISPARKDRTALASVPLHRRLPRQHPRCRVRCSGSSPKLGGGNDRVGLPAGDGRVRRCSPARCGSSPSPPRAERDATGGGGVVGAAAIWPTSMRNDPWVLLCVMGLGHAGLHLGAQRRDALLLQVLRRRPGGRGDRSWCRARCSPSSAPH